jgi:hypothetical protein
MAISLIMVFMEFPFDLMARGKTAGGGCEINACLGTLLFLRESVAVQRGG